MSRTRYTLAFDHHNMVPAPAGEACASTAAPAKVIFKSEDGILLCYGTTAGGSVVGAGLYAPGCIYIDVSAGKVYVNSQTTLASAATFGEAT